MTRNPQPPQPPTMPPPVAPHPAGPGMQPGVYGMPQPPKPAWPTVIGIISLCFAGLGVMGVLFQILSQALGLNAQQEQMLSKMPDSFWTIQAIAQVVGLIATAFLGLGGLMVLKRRRAGRGLHLAYGGLAVVNVVLGGIVTSMMIEHMVLPSNIPPQAEKMIRTSMAAGTLIAPLVGLAYPVFLAIFFTRAKVREHMRAWES